MSRIRVAKSTTAKSLQNHHLAKLDLRNHYTMVTLMDPYIREMLEPYREAVTSNFAWRLFLKPLFTLSGIRFTFNYVLEWIGVEGVETMALAFLGIMEVPGEGIKMIKELYGNLVRGADGPYRPFDLVPNEIISEILCYSVYSRNRIGFMERSLDFKFPATTQRISKRFREITMNTPEIWSIVYINYRTHLDHITQRLRYSKIVPLEVILEHSDPSHGIVLPLARIGELLLPHRHRIRTVQCSFDLAHTLFGSEDGAPKCLKVIRLTRGSKVEAVGDSPLNLAGLSSTVNVMSAVFRPGTLSIPFANVAKLCFWRSGFFYQDYISFLQQQPSLEELAFDTCATIANGVTIPTIPFTLTRLRRYQDTRNTGEISSLLFRAFYAPNLEDLEVSNLGLEVIPGQGLEEAFTPAFRTLKRLRVTLNERTFSWVKRSLPSVTELRLGGYTEDLSDSTRNLLTNAVGLCVKSETIFFEQLPPSHVRDILETHRAQALRCIVLSTGLWGVPPTGSRKEFERVEDDQTWLLERFDVWFDQDRFARDHSRYSSWKNLQDARDINTEMRTTYQTKQVSALIAGGWGIMAWQHVHSFRDIAI